MSAPKIVHRSSFIVHRIFSLRYTIHDLRYPKRGFTLIELLVTISIIAILAAVGIVVYSSTQKSARISKRLQDMLALQAAVETYKSVNPTYPQVPSKDLCIGAINGLKSVQGFIPNFMAAIPIDPSNSVADTVPCYKYQSTVTGSEYKIWVSGSEMTSAEYKTQPQYIDPYKDGTQDCIVDASGTISGWAIYNGSAAGSCLFPGP